MRNYDDNIYFIKLSGEKYIVYEDYFFSLVPDL